MNTPHRTRIVAMTDSIALIASVNGRVCLDARRSSRR